MARNQRGLWAALSAGILLTAGCGGQESTSDEAGDDQAPFPEVVIETTLGDMVVRLDRTEMPRTTANFLGYVDSRFFDETLIHRVDDDWVIQGGGFSRGMVAKAPGPPIALETSANIRHVNGVISMAHTDDPNSANSQWFIVDWPYTDRPAPHSQLDGAFAAFGDLIEGLDVLQTISQVPVNGETPITEVVVTSMRRR